MDSLGASDKLTLEAIEKACSPCANKETVFRALSEIEASGTYKPIPPQPAMPTSAPSQPARTGDSDDARSTAAVNSGSVDQTAIVQELKKLYGEMQ